MESNSHEKIANISDQLIELLKENDENYWSKIIENIRDEYIASVNKGSSVQQFIAIMQGGMGSFLDLVLHKDRKPLINENNQLDNLRRQLYNECNKVNLG